MVPSFNVHPRDLNVARSGAGHGAPVLSSVNAASMAGVQYGEGFFMFKYPLTV